MMLNPDILNLGSLVSGNLISRYSLGEEGVNLGFILYNQQAD